MTPEEIQKQIEAGIPGASAEVEGDGSHFQATIVSEAFADLSAVRKHQLVYKALGDSMQSDIHALTIQAYTPEEWESASKFRVLSPR